MFLVGCRESNANLKPFSGAWQGHTRTLSISRDGVGRAVVYDGCCDFVVAITFRLTHAHTSAGSGSAVETVTAVRVGERSALRRPPYVGQVATLRLHYGVIDDALSGADYCSPDARPWVCGA